MSFLACWVAFPLLLAALCLGCGLLVERIDRPLPGALLLPVGFATTIVIASLATTNGVTARAAPWLVLACAAAGFALGRRRALRFDPWALGTAVAVFAVFAAPVVLSGQDTFAGYITLDDTSTFLGLTDRVMSHGRDLSGLAPSTYERVLDVNLAHGYPVGSLMPFGIGHVLVRQDAAWLFQPAIVFCAAMLALCLYALAEPLVRSRPVRALAVFIAAQPALLFAYSLWAGIKELTAAALVALVCALVARRTFVAVAVAAAAILDVLGAAGVVWLVPAIVGLAFLSRRTPRRALLAVAVALMLALPAWLTAGQFLRADNRGPFTNGDELGNLGRPLRYLQLFGIWPAEDFRVDPGHRPVAYLLVGLAIATAIFGLWLTMTRRGWGTVVYVAAAVVGIVVFAGAGSPWIAGKAYATASAAFALLAAIAIALAWERGYRAASAIVAVLLAGGVLWSNVLAYHDVWLAPRGQLHELERIGDRFAGDGPALMTEYQPYGARHFLRKLDAEGAAELRARPVYLRNGKTLDKSGYADLDQFALPSIFDYRTIVIRRSPSESTPPSPYRLVWRGSTYDVWQRRLNLPDVQSHLPLGNGIQPGAVPRCADVRDLASSFPQARLVAVPRPAVVAARFPAGLYLSPTGPTTVAGAVTTRSPGTYRAWIGGSFRGRLEIAVDGHGLGSKRHVLNNTGGWEGFGSLPLEPGKHEVTLRYGGSDLHPGSGGFPFVMGPVVLEPESAMREISVPAAKAATLCGRHLDWVEAVGSR